MFDIYLTGCSDTKWRTELKESVARDITIFDPIHPKYSSFNESEKANQVANELENLENCQIIVFHLPKNWNSAYSLLQLGDAVGRGKQVIVLLEPGVTAEEKITWYCEYYGVLLVDNLEDLVENIEECVAQMELMELGEASFDEA